MRFFGLGMVLIAVLPGAALHVGGAGQREAKVDPMVPLRYE